MTTVAAYLCSLWGGGEGSNSLLTKLVIRVDSFSFRIVPNLLLTKPLSVRTINLLHFTTKSEAVLKCRGLSRNTQFAATFNKTKDNFLETHLIIILRESVQSFLGRWSSLQNPDDGRRCSFVLKTQPSFGFLVHFDRTLSLGIYLISKLTLQAIRDHRSTQCQNLLFEENENRGKSDEK